MVSGNPFSRNRPRRIFVIGDTHRGAPYADTQEADAIIEQGLQGYWRLDANDQKIWVNDPATCCVLLGDNYEGVNLPVKTQPETIFKYSRHIDRHIQHLRELIEAHPRCKFIYVKGNHERLPEFDVAFNQLARELGSERLELQAHFRKIGDGIFAHGDQSINPRKYHVDEWNPWDTSGADGRYKESLIELHRAPLVQALHDLGNQYLPWPVGRVFLRPARCARALLEWIRGWQERHPEHAGLLQSVNHIFSGHTHDPYTNFQLLDPKTIDITTGKPKNFHFHNSGASIFRLGWKLTGGCDRINRHCFNAMSVFLNSADLDAAAARITEVISFKWPQFRWSMNQNTEKMAQEGVHYFDLHAASLRIWRADPAQRASLFSNLGINLQQHNFPTVKNLSDSRANRL
jgi:hypothetical protein